MNKSLSRVVAFVVAALTCNTTVATKGRLETDWTDRVSQLFRKKPHDDVWRMQGSEYTDTKGKQLRYITILTTPRRTSPRGCKSQAISITLKSNEYLDDLLVCQKHPCRQKLWTYAAVLEPGETKSCSEVDVSHYFLLVTPIEELALVELHDLAKCIQKNGAKIMEEKVCGVRFAERSERTSDIQRAQGKRYRELLNSIRNFRLSKVDVIAQPPWPVPMAYELGFVSADQFSCDFCTNVSMVFKTREEAEIEVFQTTS